MTFLKTGGLSVLTEIEEEEVIDYTDEFSRYRKENDYILAQGKGINFLSLRKLERPLVRADRKQASYELEYRWLSTRCERSCDQAFACAEGIDYKLLQRKEIQALLRDLKKGADVVLFNYFKLY